MAGVDTVLRLIGATVAILTIIFVVGVYVTLIEPIKENVVSSSDLAALGWGAPDDTVFLFGGLAFVGLLIVVIVWWLVSPAREDVRQEVGGPPF